MHKLIYVAGPYRAKTREGVEANIRSAERVAQEVLRQGYYPITPHLCTAHFEQVVDATDDFYLEATMETMRRCDAVVLCPGWRRSSGTLGEIEEARRLNLPVYPLVDDLPHVRDFNG